MVKVSEQKLPNTISSAPSFMILGVSVVLSSPQLCAGLHRVHQSLAALVDVPFWCGPCICSAGISQLLLRLIIRAESQGYSYLQAGRGNHS